MSPGAGPEQTPAEGGSAVIQIISEGGQIGDSYAVHKAGTLIGRVEGDATFPHDGYLSSRHAQIVVREGRYYLVDLNSRNGTFIRIKGEVELKPGDTFLVGKQLFQFSKK
jgi:pSer/pThr/pTyr-binding forkhead associated (FHA) protein